MAVRNISRASQPVFLTPQKLAEQRAVMPAGVFVMYHPQLGLITDAVAEHHGVAGLVLAHLALPFAQVAQIGGMLRQKMAQEGVKLGGPGASGSGSAHGITPLQVRPGRRGQGQGGAGWAGVGQGGAGRGGAGRGRA